MAHEVLSKLARERGCPPLSLGPALRRQSSIFQGGEEAPLNGNAVCAGSVSAIMSNR
jgi:hypothetical protein